MVDQKLCSVVPIAVGKLITAHPQNQSQLETQTLRETDGDYKGKNHSLRRNLETRENPKSAYLFYTFKSGFSGKFTYQLDGLNRRSGLKSS